MKKLLSLFLVLTMLSTCAAGYTMGYVNTHYNLNVFNEEFNNSSQAQAQMLCDLGLFKGRGAGDFALSESMTREEAAVMLVRFLGGEQEAQSGKFSHPFTDVSPWAQPYVGWLYENGFTKGISADKYGGRGFVTCWQYSTFLSRAVCGNENGIATEEEVRFYNSYGAFPRETAVGLSVRALTLPYDRVDSMKTCAQYLCDAGVFTPQQLRDAAVSVLPSVFSHDKEDYFIRQTAGVTVARAPMPGARMVTMSETGPRDYVYITVKTAGEMTVYALDYRTLEVRFSGAYPSETAWDMTYLASFGQKDFLLEQVSGGFAGSLYAFDGGSLTCVLTAEELWKGKQQYFYEKPWLQAMEDLLIMGTDTLYALSAQDIVSVPMGENTEILGAEEKLAALQTVSENQTVLSSVDLKTGTITAAYTVAADSMGVRTLTERGAVCFYGTAGYYVLVDDRLQQITDMPTAKMTARRTGAGGETVLLCHDIDTRMTDYRGRPTGDKFYYVDTATHILHPLMEIKPEWNIRVDEIWGDGSSICFSTCTAVGMDHYDTYTYVILNGKLLPQDYEAGRPELMTKTWGEYIWDEMDRLHALGASDPGPPADVRADLLEGNSK